MSTALVLLRIEHKLDLIMHAMKASGAMLASLPQLDSYGSDWCPVCEQPIQFSIDVANEAFVRSCSCRPPIPLVSGISSLMTPITSTSKEDDHEPSEGTTEESPSGAG